MPSPPSFNPGFYANFEARMNRKYDILAEEAAAKTKQASGEYQRNVADAQSLPGYREALGFHARAAGQQALEGAATEAARRYMDPDWLRGAAIQMIEKGQLPGYTYTGPSGAGAPGAGAPGAGAPAPRAGTPPPIQFQTLPGQPGQSAASSTAADAPETPSILTSPTSVADMSPEELAQWTKTAATPQGVQGPTAPAGAAARQRLADAQARQPSLLRPTTVTTSKVPATSPLYSTGFRRGTPDVKPRGYAEGDADVLLRRPLFGATPPARGGGAGAPGSALPPGGPAPMPMPGPPPGPMPGPPPSSMGPEQMAGPAPGQPVGPGFGTPYNPNAGYGIDNLGGVVDATLKMVNPDAFQKALESFRPSENIEDRRGETYNPNAPRGVGAIASDLGGQVVSGGQALASDIWKAVSGDRAAPGSLADQAGYNQIPGGSPTAGGIMDQIVGGLTQMFGGGASAAPAAPAAPSPSGGGDVGSEEYGYRKGTANVKGKGGKASGPPKGLEAILPLLAAMQGGGAGGPPAGPPVGPPPGPGPGMKKGSANVKGHKKGSANVKGKGSKGSKSADDQPPAGLEAILPALMMASKGGGAAGPPVANALPLGPGAAASPAFARGTMDVDQDFAGYLFGANEVPGQGTGRTDTVPAMLAPHEAVLNKAAADMLGRGLIAALNSQGVKQMGMGRGAAT